MKLARHGFVILTVVLTSVLLLAQVNTGTVQGVVKDPSGAVVPNATVTIVNPSTQLTRSTTTAANGSYTFAAIPPGTYDLTASAPGFASNKQRVDVSVGGRSGVDVSLGLATAQGTTIEVVGEGGTEINTVDQQVASVVSSAQIAQLPTLTRNPYALVATASNVQQDSQAGVGDARGAGFSINGQRSASTDILLDGAENVNQFDATVGQQVPLDSVHEFRVITNGMTAEYGRASGGVVNVATKSGTNALHGTAYEFNRISALASNTYDNAANGVPKPVFTRNQFGFSLGGPIVKNKVFFFANPEWIRVRSSAAQIANIPDPAFIALASPATQAFFTSFGKLRPDLVKIGTITAGQARLAPDFGTPGARFAALPAGTPVLDTVRYNAPSDAGGGAPQNTLMTVGRVDLNLTDKTQLFGRYSIFKENVFPGFINTSPFQGFETGETFMNQNVLLSVTHTFGNSFLSNTRLIWSRLNQVQPLGAAPVGPTLYINNSRTAKVNGRQVALPGYNEYTPGSAIPFGGPQNLGQIFQDFSLVKGAHTIRFGGQYIRTQDNRAFGAYEEAVEALGTTTAGGFDNFLAGNLVSFQAAVNPQGKFPCLHSPTTGALIPSPNCTVTLPVSPPSFSRSNLYNDAAVYGQDTWKVTPRLTLDLGLRWEYYGVQHNRNQQLDSNFYYGSGNTLFDQIRSGAVAIAPQSPIGSLWRPQYHNFGPRVGFAYDLFGNGRTALRGGYGISYERNFNNVTFNVIQNPPAYAVLSITPADVGGTIAVNTSNAGPLSGNVGTKTLGTTSLRNVDQNIKTAYTQQWNLTLEHAVGNNAVADLQYNGARGIHQYSISNTNEPGFAPLYLGDTTPNARLNTQYSNINNRGSNGDSYYNALVAMIRGRIRSVQTTATYTWSHSIDTLSSTFSDEVQNNGLGYLDPFNPALDKASSDYDARHRVSVSALWTLPFFTNSQNGFLRRALGGFQLAPLFTFHTGYPYTVFDCTNTGSIYNCPRAFVSGSSFSKTGNTDGGDSGGNLYDFLTIPAVAGFYSGPTVIPGTTRAFPVADAGNLPTCTGLFHTGCSFPSNMLHRNAFVGPSVWNWDMGVYKDIKITERVSLQLRGEFFDILNHKNFYVLGFTQGGADVSASPTVQVKKGGYGNPFDDHRNTQLAVKLTF